MYPNKRLTKLITLTQIQRARALSNPSSESMCVEMRLCNDSKDVMKRFEMSFLNESRNCIFNEDVSQINIAGEKVGPFKKGDQANLPNWVIESLLKHEKVDIAADDAYESTKRLQNLSREAKNSPYKLQEVENISKWYIYTAIARKTLRLQSDKTSMDPRKYEDIENLQNSTQFLVETRLSKILRIANSGAYQEKRKQMTHEERWLCEELVEILSGWRQNILE